MFSILMTLLSSKLSTIAISSIYIFPICMINWWKKYPSKRVEIHLKLWSLLQMVNNNSSSIITITANLPSLYKKVQYIVSEFEHNGTVTLDLKYSRNLKRWRNFNLLTYKSYIFILQMRDVKFSIFVYKFSYSIWIYYKTPLNESW